MRTTFILILLCLAMQMLDAQERQTGDPFT